MHRRRTNARALVSQILGTMKSQANRLAAINARRRAITHHAHGHVAHYVVRGLAPRGLKETKHRNVMVRALVCHLKMAFGYWLLAFGQLAFRVDMKDVAGRKPRAESRQPSLEIHDSANDVRCRPYGRESFRETDWQRRSCRWSAEFDLRRVLVMSSPRPSVYRVRIN